MALQEISFSRSKDYLDKETALEVLNTNTIWDFWEETNLPNKYLLAADLFRVTKQAFKYASQEACCQVDRVFCNIFTSLERDRLIRGLLEEIGQYPEVKEFYPDPLEVAVTALLRGHLVKDQANDYEKHWRQHDGDANKPLPHVLPRLKKLAAERNLVIPDNTPFEHVFKKYNALINRTLLG